MELEDIIKKAQGGKEEKKGKTSNSKKQNKKTSGGKGNADEGFSFEKRRVVYVADEIYEKLVYLRVTEGIKVNRFVSEILSKELEKYKGDWGDIKK